MAASILQAGARTAADLATELGLTPAAVRRHLDQLLDDGLVVSRPVRSRGERRRGRPAREFVLTDAGRDTFDQQYDDLAAAALRFLSETAGEDAVREFARRRMSFVERRYAELVGRHPDADPAELLAEVFSAEGYAASTRTGPVGEQLCQQHCPVAHVAAEFPQLCEAETEAIGRVLGSHVQRLATIAHGDGVCTTCIPSATGAPSGNTQTTPRAAPAAR
ncbi:helix-turn-helix transcriptional regulator [Marmoricola endophyticus]|uniref:helix-turn-helix transcriptional regulator n=1 Tax=Marmoricola endophyticus TaxID=2040280 RepID=UPI001E556F74|nr:helix-turn-helix domain-containing protein [Marmoricola endophyticus]